MNKKLKKTIDLYLGSDDGYVLCKKFMRIDDCMYFSIMPSKIYNIITNAMNLYGEGTEELLNVMKKYSWFTLDFYRDCMEEYTTDPNHVYIGGRYHFCVDGGPQQIVHDNLYDYNIPDETTRLLKKKAIIDFVKYNHLAVAK